MPRRSSYRTCQIAALTLVTLAAACRDTSPPTAAGALRPLPRPIPSTAARVKDSVVPDGTGVGTVASAGALQRTRYRIEYHNGPVKTGTPNVYFIWYGAWGTPGESPADRVISELVASLGGSSYWRTATLYPEGSGGRPSGGLVYSGASYDPFYSHGVLLAPKDVEDLIAQKIFASELPLDANGVYLVLAAANVSSPGYATDFCAFHGQVDVVGSRLPYAFVIDAARAPTACATQLVGPNGTPGVDAMASLVAAELFDSVTDGYFAAYYDRLGLEPASKCAWTYGTTHTAPNGAAANVSLGGRDYLLQQLWVPSKNGGACAMHP